MQIKNISSQNKDIFNKFVSHPLQSYEWGEFRKQTGVTVIRRGFFENNKLIDAFQLTIHKIPFVPWTIGYLPKGTIQTKEGLYELHKIAKEENCIFIQLEPNVQKTKSTLRSFQNMIQDVGLLIRHSAHPLFTRYTFQIDLTKSEEELLKAMHPKTRYNIKVAKKHGVEVREVNSDKTFERYWQLTEETTHRQGFYAHTKKYHQLQWQLFGHSNDTSRLTSHLITATYANITLTTFLLFVFHDTLYYPYGASSNEHRNTMHSTLTMWEAIRFGRNLGLKTFDLWGSLGKNPDQDDPWFGFHRFKEGFGAQLVEFIGSYDLIINPIVYNLYRIADKFRWTLLRLKK